MMPDNPTEPLLDQAAARRLTDQLKRSLAVSWELLQDAYVGRAWALLGYDSWDAYLDKELGDTRLRLPREQRREIVASMTDAGMSTRAIGSALGVDEKSVRNDRRAGAEKSAPEPEPITGEIVENRQPTGPAKSANVTAVRNWYAQQVAAAGEAEQRAEATTLGRDGKSYPIQPKPYRREPSDAERKAAEERSARSDLYSGIAKCIQTAAVYGQYQDIPRLMAKFDPAELNPPQYEREFRLDNLHLAQRFMTELIKWAEARQ